MALPHVPILALTLAKTAAAVTGNRFVGYNDQHAVAAGKALGIADYDALIGAAVAVTVLGTHPVEAGGAFAKGDFLEIGAGGKAVVRTTGVIVAVAQEASAGDGSIATVLLAP